MDTTRAQAQVWEYLRYAKRHQGKSPRTLHDYRMHYERLLDMTGAVTWPDVTLEQLRAFVVAPIQYGARGAGQEPTDGTKRVRRAAMRSLFKFLHAEGYIPRDLTLRLEAPKGEQGAPKPIAEDAWQAIYEVLLRGLHGDDQEANDADLVGLGLGLFLGLRRTEITTVKAGHFTVLDGDPMLVNFPRKGGKARWPVPWLDCARMWGEYMPHMIGGDAGTFVTPLLRMLKANGGAIHLLDTWHARTRQTGRKPDHKRPEGFILPKLVWQRLRAVSAAAGVDGGHPHMLRHGFGTYMCNNMSVPLLEVSRMMGHTSVTITQRYVNTHHNPLKSRLSTSAEVDLSEFGPWA